MRKYYVRGGISIFFGLLALMKPNILNYIMALYLVIFGLSDFLGPSRKKIERYFARAIEEFEKKQNESDYNKN